MRVRRKIITTGAITSRKLARIDDHAERLYWRIYMVSDNYGTMSGDPWDVFQLAMPGVDGATESSVASAIDDLVAVGLLERWDVDGEAWLHVRNHDRHQSADFLRKRGERRSPKPPSQVDVGPLGAEGRPEGSEGQTFASQAAPCPSGENSPPITSTSKKDQNDGSASSTAPDGGHAAAKDAEEKAKANIRRAKRQLSTLADAAEEYAGIVLSSRPASITRTHRERYERVFRPLELLHAEFGDATLRPALADAIEKRIVGNPALWLRNWCENVQADELMTGKPGGSHGDDGRVYSVAAALAAHGQQLAPAPRDEVAS